MTNLEWVRNVTAAGFSIEKRLNQYRVIGPDGRVRGQYRRRYEARAHIDKIVGREIRGIERVIASEAGALAAELADRNAERVASHRPPVWEARLPTELVGHAVYRAMSSDGEVLYVGVTNSLWTRMGRHRQESPWWAEAAEIDWAVFPTRQQAEAEERRAIKRHRPPYNIVYGS